MKNFGQDYLWEDDEDIDMGDMDPFDDEAVMDEDEDMGMDDDCPFGQMKDEFTGECVEIDYDDNEFNFDDNFDEDEYIEDMLSDSEENIDDI